MKRADYVCTKKFPGGPQKEHFLELKWALRLDPAEFRHIAAENKLLKDQVFQLHVPKFFSLCVSVCLSLCLSVYLSSMISVCLSVCLSE